MSEVTATEPVISLTESAISQIRSMVAENPTDAGKGLRVYVEQGGCAGKQYGLIFDEKRDGDLISEHQDVLVFVDPISAGHVQGSVVDFSDSLNAGGFKISNPKAKSSCGCGKSFEA